MTTLPTLEILARHHQDLLLAEVAALLHDVGKCTEAFLQPEGVGFDAVSCQGKPHVNPHKAIFDPDELRNLPYWSSLSPQRGQCSRLEEAKHNTALWRTLKRHSIDLSLLDSEISLPGFGKASIRELILWGRPLVSGQYQPFRRVFNDMVDTVAYLGRSHGAAHVEKEEAENESNDLGKQDILISTPFGYEGVKLTNLDDRLKSLPFDKLFDRAEFASKVQQAFTFALGDTRRPINEVTLWDWSSTVAALYKAALAGALLGYQPRPNKLHWHLLSVRVDSSTFLGNVVHISDLLARRELLVNGFERVRKLLEEEYPCATCIYQDENASIYVVPNLDNLLELTDGQGKSLRDLIQEKFAEGTVKNDPSLALAGEVIAEVRLSSRAWQAQKPDRTVDVPPIAEMLNAPLSNFADATTMAEHWQNTIGAGKWEVCPVCGLRPKRESDEVCEQCDGRRQSRLQTWRDNPEQTIWLGEIADHNDRVALLAGKFGLDDWLSGDLVQTMLVKAAENDPAACTPKNPSPARLRRVWETCQTFWSEIVQNILDKYPYGEQTEDPALHPLRQGRYVLTPDQRNGWKENFAYNGTVESKAITLLWQKESGDFLTISNLQLAGELKQGQTVRVSLTDTPPRKYVEFTVKDVRPVAGKFAHYRPHLTLPASPDQFLAFVPAADALAIVRKIHKQYKEQFGKVCNRLPLSLGLVFFPRKMPLMAVMDAARQMLELDSPSRAENWQVQAKTDCNPTHEDWPRSVQLTLTRDAKSIPVEIPTVMGDDETKDLWYPYWRVEGKPMNRTRWFIRPDGEHWVHVNELKQGDNVHLTPSTFDFLWLDAASRRFEIYYDDKGRRSARPSRPFYLEDLQRLDELWTCLNQLTRTQLKQIFQTIETARERWFGPNGLEESADDTTFRQFVADTLATAAWPKEHRWKDNIHQKELITAGARGELADLAELHLEILKEKNEKNEKNEGETL